MARISYLGFAWAAMFGIAGFFAQGRSTRAIVPMLWSASGVFAPLAILVALYYRIYHFEQSLPFAALALLLAGLYGYATEALVKREQRPGMMASGAIFATGALAALALAFTFALEKGWLTVALALMAPGAAWIAEKRPLPWLRWLAAIMVVVVVARIGYEPRIVGTDVGTTPFFNWLLYGYGIPAAAFWLAGWLLRKRADDLPARMVDAGAVLFTVLLAVVEIRHYVNGGDIYRPTAGITEHILYVNVGLAMTIGLERVRGRTGSVVHNIAALLIAAVTLCLIVFALMMVMEPRFHHTPVGGLFFNLILLGYGIPAVLAIALAMIARTTRPMPYRAIAAVTAVTLALVLSVARSTALLPRPDSRRLDQRRRAIHLFDRLARLWRGAALGRFLPALAAGAACGARRDRADDRQSLHHRHRLDQRHLSRDLRHRPGRGAARHRLALPAHALSAPAGDRGGSADRDLTVTWASRSDRHRENPAAG